MNPFKLNPYKLLQNHLQLNQSLMCTRFWSATSDFLQKHSRYPALPLLFDKLSDSCVIFLDDATRNDEKEILAFWQRDFPNLEHTFFETMRGGAMLHLNGINKN